MEFEAPAHLLLYLAALYALNVCRMKLLSATDVGDMCMCVDLSTFGVQGEVTGWEMMVHMRSSDDLCRILH